LCCTHLVFFVDNVKMLVHAFVASRVDYCKRVLYRVAAVESTYVFFSLCSSRGEYEGKKRKRDSITLSDDLHWLLVRQRVEFMICLLVYKCQHQLAPAYLTLVTAIATRQHLRFADLELWAWVLEASRLLVHRRLNSLFVSLGLKCFTQLSCTSTAVLLFPY